MLSSQNEINFSFRNLWNRFILIIVPLQLFAQLQNEEVKLVPQLGITSNLVESFSVSSDGKYALTGDWDGILRLWDVETGYELKKLLGENRQSKKNDQSFIQIVGGRFAPKGHQVLYWEKNGPRLGVIDFEKPSKSWSVFQGYDIAYFIDDGDAIIGLNYYNGLNSISLNIISGYDGSLIDEQKIPVESGEIKSYNVFPRDNLLFFCLSGNRSDGTAILAWDYKQKKILESYSGVGITDIKISPSGKKILGIGEDYNAYVWNRKKPKAIKRYGRESDTMLKISDIMVHGGTFLSEESEIALELSQVTGFYDDGRPFGTDRVLSKWDMSNNKIVNQSPLYEGVKFSEYSKEYLFVLSGQNSIEIWNTKQWKKDRSFKKSENGSIEKIEVSKDERLAMIEYEDARVLLLDLEQGYIFKEFVKKRSDLRSCLSADGKMIAIGDTIFSTETEEVISSYNWWYSLGFFEDSSSVLALEHEHKFNDKSTVSLVNALTGDAITTMSLSRVDQEELSMIPVNQKVSWKNGSVLKEGATNNQALTKESIVYEPIEAGTAALSPDKKVLATAAIRTAPSGKYDMSVRFWNFNTGEFLYKISREGGWVEKLEFSQDGSKLLVVSHEAEIWNLSDRTLIKSFGEFIENASFVSEDREVMVSSQNGNVALYSLDNPDSIIYYKGSHLGRALGAALLTSKNLVLSAGEDAIIRMFDAKKGDQKLRIIPRTKTDWAVIDNDGRFDYGNQATDYFIWEYQNRVYTVNQLRDEYYEPNLFAKYLGINVEDLQEVERLTAPAAYPGIESIVKKSDNKIQITVSDEGDGIGKVPIFINGRELTEDARKLVENKNKKIKDGRLELIINLKGDARIDSTNVIEAFAYDKNNYVSGRGETLSFNNFGSITSNKEPPNLHAIIVGVSDYRGDKIDLRYAAKDAEDFASALKIAASRLLLSEDKTKINVFSTNSTKTGKSPSRTNIINALKALKKTKHSDIVIIYFAGHGVIHNSSDDYYFLTKSAASANLSSKVVIKNDAISSKLLASILRDVPAEKRVLIFDTCGAGKLIDDLLERSVPSSQIRAIEELNRRTGFHVLAGSTADQLSYETSRFSQGILTHSLLMGIRGGALLDGQYIDVHSLFEYCRNQVPILALGAGGIQSPQYASPAGGETFNIGRLEPSDRELIVVQDSRPVFIRPSIIEMKVFNDRHGFSNMVTEALKNESQPNPSTGRSKIIYSAASNYPDSYQIAGPYSINGDMVNLDLKLLNSKNQVVQNKKINSKIGNVETLILKAVSEMVESL